MTGARRALGPAGGLALALLGLAGTAAAASARLPASGPALVLDAADRVVGRVLGLPQVEVALVLLSGQGKTLLLAAQTGGLRPVLSATFLTVVFDDEGCQGSAFLILPDSLPEIAPVFPLPGLGPGNVLYGGFGPPVNKVVKSRWNLGGNPAACENSVAALSNLSPAEAFFPLDFTPPLRFE